MLKYSAPYLAYALLIAGLSAPHAALAEAQNLSVKCVRKIERFEPLYKNDATGRLVYVSTSACNYRETVGAGLFDGVRSAATGLTDLSNGRGETRGITVGEKGSDNYRVEWIGRCYPIGRSGGNDLVRCSGVWSFIEGSGIGRFSGVRGGGYWHMQMTADGGIDTEATGIYDK